MAFCAACGTPVSGDYCAACGAKISVVESAPTASRFTPKSIALSVIGIVVVAIIIFSVVHLSHTEVSKAPPISPTTALGEAPQTRNANALTEQTFLARFPLSPANREVSDKMTGPLRISDSLAVSGMIDGDATVQRGGCLLLHGTITGNLVVDVGAVAYLYGTVAGSVEVNGASAIYGTIGSLREGADSAIYVDPASVVIQSP